MNSTNASATSNASEGLHEDVGPSVSYESKVGLHAAYSLIFAFGVLGNFAMIKILGRRSHLSSPGNILLLNMVVTELAVLLTNIPFDIILIEFNQRWIFGRIMCKMVWPLQTMCFGAFVWILSLLSYHRYRGVCSLNRRLSAKAMKCLIALIWIVSAATVIPFGIYLNYAMGECFETWSAHARKAFTLVLFLTQYIIPLGLNAFCYFNIAMVVRRGEASMKNHIRGSFEAEAKRSRRTLRAIRTAVIFVIIFAVCMLPHQVVWMWVEFHQGTVEVPQTLSGVAYIFTFASSFLNPFVYIFSTPSVRKELLRRTLVFKRGFFGQQHSNVIGDRRRIKKYSLNVSATDTEM